MQALVISGVVPFRCDSGAKIGILSDLKACQANGMKVTLVAYNTTNENLDGLEVGCRCVIAPVREGGRKLRFLRSLTGLLPAPAERYYSRKASLVLSQVARETRASLIVLQDTYLAGWIPMLRDLLPDAKIVARPHNMMKQVCGKQLAAASLVMKPFFAFERIRWERLERIFTRQADRVWAITDDDRRKLEVTYDLDNTRYLPLSIDLDKYYAVSLEEGDEHTFVHIGGMDMKKGPDVASFIADTWPWFRRHSPQCRLLLAGRMDYRINVTGEGVEYVGQVDSDVNFYRRGRFSINPQVVGGGIKLKSLNSMAAARTLVSTDVGVEGMAVEHGIHYWNLRILANQGRLDQIFSSRTRNLEIARAGREWVCANHSARRAAQVLAELVEDVYSASPSESGGTIETKVR